MQKVCIMGLGYIGLPMAGVLTSCGVRVLGCDINSNVVDTINKGEIHIVENQLDFQIRNAVEKQLLMVSTEPQIADTYVIAVPTPFKENYQPDLSYIEAATKKIIPLIKPGDLIILESTSPVGTTEQIRDWILEARSDLNCNHNSNQRIYVAHCPERVLPGNIIYEMVHNDRIIGGVDKDSSLKAKQFYEIFVNGDLLITNARTAEMSKLTENAFRDVNIAFANELSMICDEMSIDVWELIKLANHHPRVDILQPGPGVGGHCIAVDPWFIVSACPSKSQLIRTAREVNNLKPHHVIKKIYKEMQNFDRKVKIACFGLAFKADIDDLRESPAIEIVKELGHALENEIWVVEPHIQEIPLQLNTYAKLVDMNKALSEADILVLLVDHTIFKNISFEQLINKKLIDTRGIWNIKTKEKDGAFYETGVVG